MTDRRGACVGDRLWYDITVARHAKDGRPRADAGLFPHVDDAERRHRELRSENARMSRAAEAQARATWVSAVVAVLTFAWTLVGGTQPDALGSGHLQAKGAQAAVSTSINRDINLHEMTTIDEPEYVVVVESGPVFDAGLFLGEPVSRWHTHCSGQQCPWTLDPPLGM